MPDLDVLELVRLGALDSFPPSAPAGTVRIDLAQQATTSADLVDVTDQEGVPVARLKLSRSADGLVAMGVPVWLGQRSTRPFEQWHRGPVGSAGRTGVVVVDGLVDEDRLGRALTDAGSRPLLLALLSLDGDAPVHRLAAARRAVAAARTGQDVELCIVPSSARLSAAELSAVVDRYAAGLPVERLPSSRQEPDDGVVLFLTGLSGSGKSTIARAVGNRLVEAGRPVTLLDGDLVRRHLSAGLGFSPEDRDINIRRIGWVAAEVARHGGTAICSPIAPFASTRDAVRTMVEDRGGRLILVHVATPLAECERRDRKGLYAAARRGEIADFTGISSPYEEPTDPDLRIDTTGRDVAELADDVLALLDGSGRC